MGSNYNKIITTVNSITEDYNLLPRQNECIVIDTCNNRIGINNFNPEYSLDISNGDIKCKNIIIDNDASVNNFKNINLDNKKFAYKHPNNNEIIIESSNNKIIFDTEVEFKHFPQMPLFYSVPQFNGKLDICYTVIANDVSFGGGNITNTIIGKSGLGSYLPNLGYFTDVCINTLYVRDIEVSNNVVIDNNFLLDGDASFNKNVMIKNNLNLVNNLFCNGTISVSNDLSCNKNMYVSDDLFVYKDLSINNNTTIGNNLYLGGDASFNSNVIINKNTKIYENTDICGNLVVLGDITLAGLNKFYYGDGSKLVNVGADALILFNDASFTHVDICKNLTISNELLTYGDVSFGKTLYVDGKITGNFKLQINNLAEFNDLVDVNELEVNTKSRFKGDIFMDSVKNTTGIGKDTSFNACFINVEKNVVIDNNTLIKNKLDVSGVEISNNLFVHVDSRMNNKLDVSGVEISNNLLVHVDTSMNNKLDVSGVEISNNLLVHVDSRMNNKLDVSGVEISNNLLVHVDTRINNKLDVSGVEISNNLFVHVDSRMNNKLDVSGVEISNNLLVHVDTSMNNKLDVSGVEISNNLFVHVDSRMNNKLDVSGVEISNNLLVHVDTSMNNKLDVSGVEISNNLLVHVDSRMNNKLDVSGVEISNNILIHKNATINNLLDTSGLFIYNDISFNGLMRGDGSLLTNVGKDALTRYNDGSFNNFDISGNFNFLNTASLYVDCKSTFNNDIDMNRKHLKRIEDLTAERILIYKDSSFNNGLFVERDVSFNRNLYVHGRATFNSEFTLNQLVINDKIDSYNINVTNKLSSYNDNIFYKKIDASSIDVSNIITAYNSNITNKLDVNNLQSNNLTINNDASFNNDCSFNKNIYIKNNIDISGNVNKINLQSFKLKGANFATVNSNSEYQEFTNRFQNSNNIAGCYINGINDLLGNNNYGFNITQSGIYNVTFTISWAFTSESIINGTIISIGLAPINTLNDSNDQTGRYDSNYNPSVSQAANYYESFAYTSFGPLSEKTFSVDSINGAFFVQSINENIFLKKYTTLRAFVKAYNSDLESSSGSNELKIDIDLGKSSWGATFINPL